jgi:hypothetical protein
MCNYIYYLYIFPIETKERKKNDASHLMKSDYFAKMQNEIGILIHRDVYNFYTSIKKNSFSMEEQQLNVS